jgi:SAM-dependent methyltransferase
MTAIPSARIARAVAALPLRPGMRVLEIGCGPGVAAREVLRRMEQVVVVGIDRSPRAIALALRGSQEEIASGRLEFRRVAIEDFELELGEPRFDLAFALRVGALDGRHPSAGRQARQRLREALDPGALLSVDDLPPVAARDLLL